MHVLLADDNEDHRFLTKRALESVPGPVAGAPAFVVHDVRDGEQAIAFVRRRGAFAASPRPDFILLDIKMPRKDGFAVLEDLKADPATRGIPIIMLTSSDSERDVARSYGLGSNSYVTKPLDVREFQQRIAEVSHFWGRVATLPGSAAPARGATAADR